MGRPDGPTKTDRPTTPGAADRFLIATVLIDVALAAIGTLTAIVGDESSDTIRMVCGGTFMLVLPTTFIGATIYSTYEDDARKIRQAQRNTEHPIPDPGLGKSVRLLAAVMLTALAAVFIAMTFVPPHRDPVVDRILLAGCAAMNLSRAAAFIFGPAKWFKGQRD